MNSLLTDLRFALRRLARAPGYVATVILLLALALGANACVFSVVYGLLYKPLPFANADRLASIDLRLFKDNSEYGFPVPVFMGLAEHPEPLKAIAGYWPSDLISTDDNQTDGSIVKTIRAEPRLFDMLGVRPALGRALVDADADAGASGDVLVSWQYAQHRFGSAEKALGKILTFREGHRHTIAGVMPANFHLIGDTQVWLALKFSPQDRQGKPTLFDGLRALAELAPGTQPSDADEALTAFVHELPELRNQSDRMQFNVHVEPLRHLWLGERRGALEMMLLAAILVALVTSANICNLTIARASARQHEIALLEALGAGSWRRVRMAAFEVFALGGVGMLFGFASFPIGLNLLRYFDLLPTDTPQPIAVDAIVFAYIALLAATIAAAMLACTLWLRRGKVFEALRQGGTRQTAGRDAERVRRGLIVAQIALTASLLVGTGLLLRSANRLLNADIGFDREHTVLATLAMPPQPKNDDGQLYRTTLQTLTDRAAVLPGVSSVGRAELAPFRRWWRLIDFLPPGGDVANPSSLRPAYSFEQLNENYFDALGVSLIAGRGFTVDDVRNEAKVVVVDDDFAKQYFPAGDALGKTLRLQDGTRDNLVSEVVIVGIAATIKWRSLDQPVDRPSIYRPGPLGAQLVVRARMNPAVLTRSLQNLLHEIVPLAKLDDIATMNERIADTLEDRTRLNILLELLSGVALILAAIGLYAVLAYSVRQRRNEFGIRMALGASAQRVLRDVLGHGLRLIGIGLLCGLPLAYLFARSLSARLYQIDAFDPVTLITVAALLAAIGLIACWWPARIAARVDPMNALRAD